RRRLVHPDIELLVGQRLVRLVLRLRDEDERGLVLVLREVPVHAVVARIEPAAHEPLPERRVTGVERGVPVLIPGEEIPILPEALREAVEAEAFHDPRVGEVGLADEFCRGLIIVFLFPVDGDLRLADGHSLRVFPGAGHCRNPPSRATPSPEVCSACSFPAFPFYCSAPSGFRERGVYYCVRRSEEHTSELQSRENLVCRLL